MFKDLDVYRRIDNSITNGNSDVIYAQMTLVKFMFDKWTWKQLTADQIAGLTILFMLGNDMVAEYNLTNYGYQLAQAAEDHTDKVQRGMQAYFG